MLRYGMGAVARLQAAPAAALAALMLTACQQTLPPAGSATGPADPPRQTLASAFRQCTIDHEYDPDEAGGIAGDALGEGEAEWRECAYAALERVLQPTLREPEALGGLIEEDRRQTQAISTGTSTRAERSEAVGARLDVMVLHEEALRQQELSEMSAGELLSALPGGQDPALHALRADLGEVRDAMR